MESRSAYGKAVVIISEKSCMKRKRLLSSQSLLRSLTRSCAIATKNKCVYINAIIQEAAHENYIEMLYLVNSEREVYIINRRFNSAYF